MTTKQHPTTEELIRLLSGELAPRQAAAVLSHAEECSQCEQLCEAIWAEMGPQQDRASSDIDPETAVVIEEQLLTRLHRGKFAESVLDLGSQGFLLVVVGLLRPIVRVFSVFTLQSSRKE